MTDAYTNEQQKNRVFGLEHLGWAKGPFYWDHSNKQFPYHLSSKSFDRCIEQRNEVDYIILHSKEKGTGLYAFNGEAFRGTEVLLYAFFLEI